MKQKMSITCGKLLSITIIYYAPFVVLQLLLHHLHSHLWLCGWLQAKIKI